MICSSCGTENRAGAKFCTECATPFAAPCPACGTANPPGAKFCSECATPLRPGAPAVGSATAPVQAGATGAGAGGIAERRVVSVVFADLVGFTTFAEGRDTEEVRETLGRYFELASEIVGRYGGTVEKFIGDAVMAVWGTPTAREDDAERAVRAALDLVAAVSVLGPGIQARGGVLTGEAAVTVGALNQGMVAGDLVNTAARLQSVAPPGGVLVGEPTQRAAASAIAFEPAGEHALKGKVAPVPAWLALRVVAERGGRNRSDALEAPFVGRDDELRLIKDQFHATVRDRRPRLVSVIGAGGIGKTRLAWEFLKYVDGLVDTVWWHSGRSPAYGDGITFWALGEMIRARAGLTEADPEAVTRERIAATLREHVPDDDERRWIEAALLALLGVDAGAIGPDQLFAAWRTFFERLAGTYPVVLVFEDLHHADAGLLDFIDHLLEWSRTQPILVVTLARPELLERRADWGAGTRLFASIHLEPLPAEAMHRLLDGLVPGLPPRASEAIVARADGVPLYAVETVRMLLAQGRIVQDGDVYRPTGDLGEVAVPETLAALIAARLDVLDPTDRDLVEDAAVLGQSFSIEGLTAVSGLDRAELERRLRALARREIVTIDADPRSPERGQYAFVQSLIREVAYNRLAKRERKTRHLAAARYFEQLGSGELAGGLAGHYLAAQRLATDADEAAALAAQARIALRGAAERAAALGSYLQALTFIEQAIEITTDDEDLAELHTRAMAASRQGLALDRLQGHAEAVVDARHRLGDRRGEARALADLARVHSGVLADPERALEILVPAWDAFPDQHDTDAGAYLAATLAGAYRSQTLVSESVPWAERALDLAERLDLLDVIALVLLGLGSARLSLGRAREGLVLTRGGHQLALAEGLQDVERSGRTLLTFYEQWGDPATGLALAREGLEIAARSGSRFYGAAMVGNGSICALRVGEWAWAETLLDEWIVEDTTDTTYMEYFVDRAILTALRGGDPAPDIERAARLRVAASDPQYESYELWARSWAALAAGEFAAAHRHAVEAARITDFFLPLSRPLAARAALWAGDAAGAAELLDSMRTSGYRGAAFGLDQRTVRAGFLALGGETAEALALYREVFRGWRQLGLVLDEALAVVDLVRTLDPVPDQADVREAIAWARDALAERGATPFLPQLDAALAGRTDRARPSVDAAALPVADPV